MKHLVIRRSNYCREKNLSLLQNNIFLNIFSRLSIERYKSPQHKVASLHNKGLPSYRVRLSFCTSCCLCT